MSKKFFLLLLIFVGKNCDAQNLVPNPSFEDTVACPDNLSEVFNCLGWNSYRCTPDYFNVCSIGEVAIPQNSLGSQLPSSGNAYCGFVSEVPNLNNYSREIIGAQLNSSLVIGTKYYVSIKVSLAGSSHFASNMLGVNFYMSSHVDSLQDCGGNCVLIDNSSKVWFNNLIIDTTNWITLQSSFIADSAYSYLAIGNFFDDSLITYDSISSSNNYEAYYYIDDVCVSPDSLECDLNPEGIYPSPKNKFTIYPNPATQQLTIDNGQLLMNSISIYDVLGREVYQSTYNIKSPEIIGTSKIINLQSFPVGVYFVKVRMQDGSVTVKKFVRE